jgi:hypothetical protein
VNPGAKLECLVDFGGGKQASATLKVLNEGADVEFVRLSPGK